MSRRLVTAVLLSGLVALPGATTASATTPAPAATRATATSMPTRGATGTAPASAPKAATLRNGSRGAAVTALQTRLNKNGYWVGTPTGYYGHSTAQAVMALQKVAGLSRDGVAGPATMKALNSGIKPKPRSTTGRVVEVDLKRQVLMFVVDGRVTFTVNTSTGAPATPTPRGTFRIYRQVEGWRTAPLGKLYRPKYFTGGYAIHGVQNGAIPGYPASHGCTRVSMAAMDMMWSKAGLKIGDRVRIY